MLCDIDGDRYRVALPLMEEWTEIKETVLAKRLELPSSFFMHPFFLMPKGAQKEDLHVSSLPDFPLQGTSIAYPYGKVYWFRPVLIPLDRKGNNIAKYFQKDNENGTILHGGSFYYFDFDNKHRSIPLRSDQDVPIIKDVKKSCITLQNSYPAEDAVLDWLCWNGKMWCMWDIMQTDPDQLEALGLFENIQ